MDQNSNSASDSDKTFEYIFENIIDGVGIVDVETKKFSLGNRAMCRMLGYTKEELTGIAVYDIHPEEALPRVEKLFNQLANREIETAKNIPVLAGGGQLFYADISASPIMYKDRLHLVSTFRNITDRHETELQKDEAIEKLRKSEARLKAFLDQASIAIAISKNQIFTFVNIQFVKMFGYDDAAEFIGRNIYDFISINEHTKVKAIELPTKDKEIIINELETVVMRKDGSEFWIHAAVSEVYDYGSLGFITDITGRKNAESELRHKEEILRAILNSTADGILLVDNNKKISHLNRQFKEMWSIPDHILDSVDDTNFLNFVTNQLSDPEKFIEKVEYLYNNDEESYDEVNFKNGRIFERYSSPLIFEGDKYGRIWDFRDVTSRKYAEEELRKSEAIMKTLFDAAPIGIAHLVNRIHLRINSMLCKMHGYTAEEMIGHSTEMLYVSKEESDKTSNLVYSEVREKGFCMTEAVYKRKDGSLYDALLCVRSISQEDPSSGVIAIVLDITDRKRAEKEVRHKEEILRAILNTTADGILMVDNNKKISYINRQLIEMWNVPDYILDSKDDDKLLGFVMNQVADAPAFIEKVEYLYGNNEESYDEVSFKNGLLFERYSSPLLSDGVKFGRIWDFRDITSRRQAEEELRESEEKYRTLIEDMQDATYRADLDGNIVFTSPSAARMVGCPSPELMIGKNLSEEFYYHPEDREKLLLELREKGKVEHYEVILKRKDNGEPVIVSTNSHFYHDKNGNIIGIEGVFSDITEQKKVLEELRKSEERFAKAFQSSPAAITMAELSTGVIISVNRQWEKLFGYTAEEAIGRNAGDLHLTSDIKARDEYIKQLVNKGSVTDQYAKIRSKSGEIKEILFSIVIIKLGDRDVMLVLYQDITERKKAEEQLQKSEALLNSIIDASPAGILVLVGRLPKKVNSTFCTMTGFSQDELVNQSTRQLYFTDEEFERVGSIYRKKDRNGVTMIETLFRHKSGSELHVLIYLSSINPFDEYQGDVAVVLDITEQKKMEVERSRLEEMLLHSQKIESLGRLAGGIAHDFNNLLTAIMGNTEMAMLQLDPAGKPYSRLAIVKNAAEGAASLTKQLLAFSRKQIIEPKIINLNGLIGHVQKMIPTLLGENINLKIVLSDDLPSIKGDPGQIEQVIINLAANARDAMPDGGDLVIETSTVYLDSSYTQTHPDITPGNYVMMAVTDNGTGMSKEVMAHVFEPFFTTKEMGHGTGLGLATAYGIVKQNGGTIEIYSEMRQGTVFKLYFPAYSQFTAEPAVDEENLEMPGGTETILVVEDKNEVLEFCRDILQQLGYKVLTAINGEEALNVAVNYNDNIHLFMTDVILPGMNGRAVAEKISALRPGIRVLYNSGYTSEVIDKQGILEKGINFISKPFTPQALSVKIREILDKKQ